jgi:hypothetical protein
MAKRAVLFLLLTLSLANLTFGATNTSSTLPSTLTPTNKLEPDTATYIEEKTDEVKSEPGNGELNGSLPNAIPMLQSVTTANPKKLSVLEKAYLDVFTILNDENSCSQLYGGPPAIAALNELFQRLHPTYLDRNIAIRMKGATTIYESHRTKFSFRVFDVVEVNREGAFFRGNNPGERRIPLIGAYQPNTRESRVVVLLHELGHMVRSKNAKTWLFADDGDDIFLSQKNSEMVIQACQNQIESVGKLTPAQQIAKGHSPRETIAARTDPKGTSQF